MPVHVNIGLLNTLITEKLPFSISFQCMYKSGEVVLLCTSGPGKNLGYSKNARNVVREVKGLKKLLNDLSRKPIW